MRTLYSAISIFALVGAVAAAVVPYFIEHAAPLMYVSGLFAIAAAVEKL